MINLDSDRWESLKAFDSSKAVVEVIRKLDFIHEDDDEVDSLLAELDNQLCHQLSIMPIAYAAIPHIIRIAERRHDKVGTALTVITGTIIAFSRDIDLDQIDCDIKEWYLNSIENFKQLTYKRVDKGKILDFENIYLFWSSIVAILGPSNIGRVLIQHSFEEFEEIEIDSCPKCDEYIFITNFCSAEDYDTDNYKLIPIRKKSRIKLKWKGFINRGSAEKLLMFTATKFNDENVIYLVQNLFGKVTCPHCKRKFILLNRLLEINE